MLQLMYMYSEGGCERILSAPLLDST